MQECGHFPTMIVSEMENRQWENTVKHVKTEEKLLVSEGWNLKLNTNI